LPSELRTTALQPEDSPAVAELINVAYDDWRALPRVTAYAPEEPARVGPDDLLRAAERGDLAPEACLVLWDGNEPVAVVTMAINGGSKVVRLGWLAVRPDYRRQGLGMELLRHAEAVARQADVEAIVTGSSIDSRYACRLLERAGMRWVDPDHCNITMQMDISQWQPVEPRVHEGFVLRTWQDGDEQAWTEVKRITFEDNTPLGYWQSKFGSRPDFDPAGWYLCFEGDKPAGIASAVLTRYPDTGEVMGCCIEWVGVRPEYRGLGLGRSLMVACLNYACRFQPEPFVLVTQRFRQPAVKLYESLGFRIVRDWRTYEKRL